MKLNIEEQVILDGQQGVTLQKCLKSLVKYGEFFNADRLVPISHGHLAMSSGANLFETYLDVFTKLAGAGMQFKVPTTINPRYFKEPRSFLEKLLFTRQDELEKNFLAMGGIPNFSCAPYFGANVPIKDEILAWAESSAVIYANSIIGARTNRNSVVIDLFSAVLGVTPNFGLLLDENRKADYQVTVDKGIIANPADFVLLGYYIGELLQDKIPYIKGIPGSVDDLKNMGAAMAASGGIGMYHVEGVTPEAKESGEKILKEGFKTLAIKSSNLTELKSRLAIGRKKVNLVFIGCPHLSLEELIMVTRLMEGHRVKKRLWINSAPEVIETFKKSKHYEAFQQTGSHLLSICPYTMFNSPSIKKRHILTNSGKMRYYSPIYFGTLEECLEEAMGGGINDL
ncbi:MAG: aconitase X catalytic domain-containing protein [Candidatus Hodarchaeota archaeon]